LPPQNRELGVFPGSFGWGILIMQLCTTNAANDGRVTVYHGCEGNHRAAAEHLIPAEVLVRLLRSSNDLAYIREGLVAALRQHFGFESKAGKGSSH